MDKRFSTKYDSVKESYSVDYVAYRKNARVPNVKVTTLGQSDEHVYNIETERGPVFTDAMGLLVVGG
jgi:hypothetical protein